MGINQVNQAVSDMDKAVQQNAAGSEELSLQAQNLRSNVDSLISITQGSQATPDGEASPKGAGFDFNPQRMNSELSFDSKNELGFN